MLIHEPIPSRPSTPMRESKELPRSEQLLRDALMRDDARTPPRTPMAHKHQPRTVRERGKPELHGCTSEKRRRMGAYGGDSEFSMATWERERSPSPTPQPRRRQSVSRSCRASSPFRGDFTHPTTHEVVLRTRLEGVLMTARSIQDCLERSESPDMMASCSSRSDCSDSLHRESRAILPPTPSTSSSGCLPDSRSHPGIHIYEQEHDYDDTHLEAQMLTPPPTPPYLSAAIPYSPHHLTHTSITRKSSKRQRSDPLPTTPRVSPPPLPRSPSSPQVCQRNYGSLNTSASPASPIPQFNVRAASAQCRDMPGYVSFAAIEGLGAPDNLDCNDDDQNGRRAAKDHSGGLLWGFLGRRKN